VTTTVSRLARPSYSIALADVSRNAPLGDVHPPGGGGVYALEAHGAVLEILNGERKFSEAKL